MSAVQTTYDDNIGQAYLGMIVNTEPNNLISREAEVVVPFGRVVKQGTADNQVELADNASDTVRGISVRDYSAPESEFAINDSVLVMDRGVIWVTAGVGGATAGAPAYMVPATGKFTVTSTANLVIPNAIFDSSGAADELVKVRIK